MVEFPPILTHTQFTLGPWIEILTLVEKKDKWTPSQVSTEAPMKVRMKSGESSSLCCLLGSWL